MRWFRSIWDSQSRPYLILAIILFIGLINGIFYLFALPPWQHYDEPGHFEYGWLAASQAGWPDLADSDLGIQREISASMVEHGFFKDMDIEPKLADPTLSGWIGISQTGDRPFYYFLISLPLRLFHALEISAQLYVARLFSLSFYLLTILAAWGIIRELSQPESHLRWMVPFFVAVLPGLADLMTAVNNDVAAVGIYSLLLWGCVRLIRRGFSLLNTGWVLVFTVIAFWTKSTIYIAIPVAIISFVFTAFRGRARKWAWIGVAAVTAAMLLLAITSSQALYWYPFPRMEDVSRQPILDPPLGNRLMRIYSTPDQRGPQVRQFLSSELVEALSGKTVSLGVWMWASQPVTAQPPFLMTASAEEISAEPLEIATEPRFYWATLEFPQNSGRTWLVLPSLKAENEPVEMFYDGVVLVEGDLSSADQIDISSDSRKISLPGEELVNLVRNPSFESSGLSIRPRVEKLLTDVFPGNLSYALLMLPDWTGLKEYYITVLNYLFQTFWARFAWGHVTLGWYPAYYILLGLSLIGLLGGLILLVQRRRSLPWEIIFLFGLGLAFNVFSAFVRGLNTQFSQPFIPSSRYIYPSIIPAAVFLVGGWNKWFAYLQRWLKIRRVPLDLVYIAGLFLLNFYSWWTIINYYYRPG